MAQQPQWPCHVAQDQRHIALRDCDESMFSPCSTDPVRLARPACASWAWRTSVAQTTVPCHGWLEWVVAGSPGKNDNLVNRTWGTSGFMEDIYIIIQYIYITPVLSSKPTLHWVRQMDVPSSCYPNGSSNKTSQDV